jgi:hypothetical protein
MKTSRLTIPAVLLFAGLTLAGCSAVGSGSSSSAGSSAPGASSHSNAVAPAPVERSTAASGTGSIADTTPTVDRAVVITGTVTITATDPISAAAQATSVVESAGGRIDGRTENAAANGDKGSATLVLRIPAAELTSTLDALKKLGRADQVQLDSVDVTSQTRDLGARIDAARATIARLLQLESTATDTTNLIAIETAVGDRQGELESMEAQQRGLADQVSMSTVTLQLRSDAAAPPVKPADFWSGLGTGWAAFAGFWAAALVALAVLLPWLALAGVGTAAVLLTLRILRRRARRGATAPAAATPPAPIG